MADPTGRWPLRSEMSLHEFGSHALEEMFLLFSQPKVAGDANRTSPPLFHFFNFCFVFYVTPYLQ